MQIKEPVVCGIASLGMDHMEILGKPLQNIEILLLVLLFFCGMLILQEILNCQCILVFPSIFSISLCFSGHLFPQLNRIAYLFICRRYIEGNCFTQSWNSQGTKILNTRECMHLFLYLIDYSTKKYWSFY